jgi:hypothetical protein
MLCSAGTRPRSRATGVVIVIRVNNILSATGEGLQER